jgi:glycosyltransferase involved in cell wall biosynthesis
MKIHGRAFDVYYFHQWPLLHSIFAKPGASKMVQEWCEVWYEKIVFLEKLIKRLTNHHVAVSEFTKRRMIEFLHVDPEKIAVIPNGVDFQKFNENSYKKKWGRIVFVGRIVPHKHVDMLIDAFRIVKLKIPKVELHIIGSGPIFSAIKKQASQLNDIHIHGYLPEFEMLNILKSSWLSILPSEREGSGIAALESFATGTPVITVNYPDNAAKDLCIGGAGIVVQPNSNNIAPVVQKLYNDQEKWEEMSEKARLLARQYDWKITVTKLEDYLNDRITSERN